MGQTGSRQAPYQHVGRAHPDAFIPHGTHMGAHGFQSGVAHPHVHHTHSPGQGRPEVMGGHMMHSRPGMAQGRPARAVSPGMHQQHWNSSMGSMDSGMSSEHSYHHGHSNCRCEDLCRSLLWGLICCAGTLLALLVGLMLLGQPGQPQPPTFPPGIPPGVPPLVPGIPGQVTETLTTTFNALPPTSTVTITSTTTTRPRPVCPATARRISALEPAQPRMTEIEDGCYDLRVLKGGSIVGCASPRTLFPRSHKYGCAGKFGTPETCDAAESPIRDTAFVWSVHDGCMTMDGKGTYGYPYDDGVGLKQCSPMTKYEWVLCPNPELSDEKITWQAEKGVGKDSTKRFRVTNNCQVDVWLQQAGAEGTELPLEAKIILLPTRSEHTYSIPNVGMSSTRYIPKTGCDATGNNCNVQALPPCPPQGCDMDVDTKFEASWGCQYATGDGKADRKVCSLTAQDNPSTYQDWWDGSAVDGWTVPFKVLVDDGGRGLRPGEVGSPEICGSVICDRLDPARYCPMDEFLTA